MGVVILVYFQHYQTWPNFVIYLSILKFNPECFLLLIYLFLKVKHFRIQTELITFPAPQLLIKMIIVITKYTVLSHKVPSKHRTPLPIIFLFFFKLAGFSA